MKAVRFIEIDKPLQIADVSQPAAVPGGLVFKVKACGICASDLHAAETPGLLQTGNILGHEYVGEVVEVGPDVTGWRTGDRMIALPAKPCGACAACQRGAYLECSELILQGFDLRMPGGYAEYSSSMAAMAMKIPDSLSNSDAALIEPLTVGLGAWKAAQVATGTGVLIIGAGIIGLGIAKWAKFFGAGDVGVSEMVPARQARARQAGVDMVINAAKYANPVAEYERLTGRQPSVIFECVGRPLIAKLIEIAPIGAHLLLVGTGMQLESFTVLSAAMKRLRMTFTLGYAPEDFGFVVRMLGAGRITTESLVTATVPLDQVPAMFQTLQKPNDHCKVLITP